MTIFDEVWQLFEQLQRVKYSDHRGGTTDGDGLTFIGVAPDGTTVMFLHVHLSAPQKELLRHRSRPRLRLLSNRVLRSDSAWTPCLYDG